ncbi:MULTISPECIES: hypothetical protein [Mycobacteriaceae]|uniref:hypothetical protein n=1 Tax=Mycobacteriaceae TaxID=1762 RepID=UPI002571210D|nr:MULTISPECIES: hypothetical protein [Mycobacteriaceae]MDO3058494.1 hypothetical protein [Mycobacteroides abscessus subsp. abscessus]MDO3277970.1 hypothetical protein [Mycobacteroides abscessus subsp. abscessus]
MTENAPRGQFVGPHLSNGDRVAIALPDGLLCTGVWLDGVISTKTRTLAPWRIHKRTDGGWTRWAICKQHALDECEPWCYFETSAEAYKAFAAFEPGVF